MIRKVITMGERLHLALMAFYIFPLAMVAPAMMLATGHVDDWYAANAGGNGQDIQSNLFGNILRIDVDNGSPYGIPADNPFVGKDGLDEIYAYGFRNPFRMSFDMGGNHDLIAGDAGQSLYEEIDLVTKGGNYGWNVKEGRACFNAAANTTTMPSCPSMDNFNNPLIDPVVVVNNSANPQGGRALTIIGGNVYRGTAIPEYQGKYIFGSFGQGRHRMQNSLSAHQRDKLTGVLKRSVL